VNKSQNTKAVLIVGGYGVVGAQIAFLLRQRHPDIPLIIAGRNIKKAQQIAESLGNAAFVEMDVTKDNQISPLKDKLSAIVTATNDPNNFILLAAIKNDIPYIDITRWTSRLKEALIRVSVEKLTQPVIFSSAWMAGVAALIAKKMSEKFSVIESIDIDILFSLQDKAGPNSIEYADQLGTSFDVFEKGVIRSIKPMTEAKAVNFESGLSTNAYRFDTPDQLTLPIICSANGVSSRITYDDKYSGAFLSFMVRSGLWSIINRPAFTKIRHSLIYNPGEGGPHEILVSIKGRGVDGTPQNIQATILDKKGQTHLTALGSVIQVERILALNGNNGSINGVTFPEQHENIDIAIATLESHDVSITYNNSPS